MSERRFLDPHQPQTLQIAVILLYIDAFFLLLRLLGDGAGTLLGPVMFVAMAAGGFGIANEKKWGYALGVFGAALNLVYPFLLGVSLSSYLRYDPIGLLFAVALVALLLHPMSRDYQRIWFK